MATKKISELEAITEADDSDVLAIVDVSEGKTNKITKNNLLIGAGHSIEMSLNQETYALTLILKNAAGTELNTASIDLPNENSITDISYNNGKLTLTKQSGATSQVDISGLINGLVTESDFETFTTALQETIGAINVKNEQQDLAIENNYKVITKLQEDVEDLTERVEDAENNELTYTPEISTSHYLQDSADSRFRKFIPIGRTTQESTTGANLQKFNARETATYNYKCDEKGQVTITGNISSYVSLGYNLSSNPMTLTAGTYKLKVIGKISSNTSILLNGTTGITLDSNQEYTYVLSNDTSSFYIALSVNTGTHDDNFYITLASGTTATTERYTGGEPAPNPIYPYAIKNTGDNVNEFDENILKQYKDDEDEEAYIFDNQTLHNQNLTPNIQFKEKTSYAIQYIAKQVSGNPRLQIIYTDNTSESIPSGGIISTNYEKYTIITNSNKTVQQVMGIYSTNVEKAFYIKKNSLKIEQGTKATPYSPYGCGNVNEKVQNKNLFTEKNMTSQSWLNGSGVVTYISTAVTTDYIKAPLSRECIFSNINTAPTGYFAVNQYDANKNRIAGAEYNTTTNFNQTFTLRENCVYIRISIYNYEKSSNNQLEVGTSKTDYIAHSEQNISFPLAQGQKLMEGDYLDDDEKVHHVRKEILLKDLTWSLRQKTTTNLSTYSASLKDRKYGNNLNMLCSHFKYLGEIGAYDEMMSFNEGISAYYKEGLSGTTIYINAKQSNLEEFQALLSEENVKLQYELAEEITEDFTEEQKTAWEEWKKARTFKNVTHISSEDETPANVELEYVQDTKTYIDNKVTALTNAIISQGGNV